MNEQNNVIISAVENIGWGFKLKDEKGLVYNVSQFKKGTQEQTVAYGKLTGLPNNGLNLKKTLVFNSVPNSQGGNSRYVTNILDIPGQMNTISQGERNVRVNIAETKTKAEEDKWAEISKGKVRHGVSCEFIRLGKGLNESIDDIEAWVEYIMNGKKEDPLDDVTYLNKQELETEEIPF
jgi:hypothetical protein